MEKSQREYYLNEQIKAIQKELGEITEEGNELEQLEKSIAKAGMSKEAKEKADEAEIQDSEEIYKRIDKLEETIDEKIEEVLNEILPVAFSISPPIARRRD